MKSIAEQQDCLRPDGTGEFDGESFYHSKEGKMVKGAQNVLRTSQKMLHPASTRLCSMRDLFLMDCA